MFSHLLNSSTLTTTWSKDSSVDIVPRLLIRKPRYCGSIRGTCKMFLPSKVSRPALGSNQPPIQQLPRIISPTVSDQVVKLTAHNHLVPRLSKRRAMSPPPTRLHDVHRDNSSTGDRLQWQKFCVFSPRRQTPEKLGQGRHLSRSSKLIIRATTYITQLCTVIDKNLSSILKKQQKDKRALS